MAEEERHITDRDFGTHGHLLEMVTSLQYLGLIILAADNAWPAVVNYLSWARTFWRRMLLILSREGAAPRVSGFSFNAVVQAVLLFRSDTWVVTPLMGKALGKGLRPRWQDG